MPASLTASCAAATLRDERRLSRGQSAERTRWPPGRPEPRPHTPTESVKEKREILRVPYGHPRCPLRAAPRPCGGAGAPLRFGSGAILDGASRAGIGDALAAPRAVLPLPCGTRGGSPVGSRRSARGGRRADPNPARTHPQNSVKEKREIGGCPMGTPAVHRRGRRRGRAEGRGPRSAR